MLKRVLHTLCTSFRLPAFATYMKHSIPKTLHFQREAVLKALVKTTKEIKPYPNLLANCGRSYAKIAALQRVAIDCEVLRVLRRLETLANARVFLFLKNPKQYRNYGYLQHTCNVIATKEAEIFSSTGERVAA